MSTITNETVAAVVVEESGGESESVTVHLDIDHHHRMIGSKLLTNFYRSIKFKLDSNIIINNNIEISSELIYHTKHSSSSPPQLLYRGTRDGFKALDFHFECDYKGPTLTIIKSSEPYNQIFGGFTTQDWESSDEFISDDSSFLFRIIDYENNQIRKFNIKQDKKQFAILAHPDYLATFGCGYDIVICSDCNLNNDSYSYLGNTYELPLNNELEYGSEKAKSYLAGSYNFKVSEIEVFKITTTIQ